MLHRRVCPICRSCHVSRSQKHGFVEKVMFTVARIRPYRCLDCDARFLQRASAAAVRELQEKR